MTSVDANKPKEMSIVDDFMYGSNVATAHVSIRLGKLKGRNKWLLY